MAFDQDRDHVKPRHGAIGLDIERATFPIQRGESSSEDGLLNLSSAHTEDGRLSSNLSDGHLNLANLSSRRDS